MRTISSFQVVAVVTFACWVNFAQAGNWSCKYESGPSVFLPTGSNACGEHPKAGPSVCGGLIYCEQGDQYKRITVMCDALSDGSCPSADLCRQDSAFSGVAKGQLAKDDAVSDFWGKRDESMERRRRAKLDASTVTSNPANQGASRLSSSSPPPSHKTNSNGIRSGDSSRGLR